MRRHQISVTIFRAQDTAKTDPVPTLKILAFEPVPDVKDQNWNVALEKIHGVNGGRLADALMQCLPGGTIDALLVELLKRKASLLTVRF